MVLRQDMPRYYFTWPMLGLFICKNKSIPADKADSRVCCTYCTVLHTKHYTERQKEGNFNKCKPHTEISLHILLQVHCYL